MTEKSKTEITIETDRTFIIRRRRTVVQAWCADCSEVVKMAPPDDAANLAKLSSREIYRAVEADSIHFLETIEGLLLVCLNSLALIGGRLKPEQLRDDYAAQPLPQLTDHKGLENPEQSQAVKALGETTWDVTNPDGSTSRKKNWVLTREALNKLLVCLDADREVAARKYEIIRRKLIKYFECRGCFFAEDYTDETINRVARRIYEGKEIWTREPASYFYGVARNVLKEYWSGPDSEFTPIECLPPLAHPHTDTLKQKEAESEQCGLEQRLASLDYCLQNLSPDSREIILSYYQGEKRECINNRRRMAEQLGIPSNALRIRVHRIREKLERSVAERLEQLPGF